MERLPHPKSRVFVSQLLKVFRFTLNISCSFYLHVQFRVWRSLISSPSLSSYLPSFYVRRSLYRNNNFATRCCGSRNCPLPATRHSAARPSGSLPEWLHCRYRVGTRLLDGFYLIASLRRAEEKKGMGHVSVLEPCSRGRKEG